MVAHRRSALAAGSHVSPVLRRTRYCSPTRSISPSSVCSLSSTSTLPAVGGSAGSAAQRLPPARAEDSAHGTIHILFVMAGVIGGRLPPVKTSRRRPGDSPFLAAGLLL